MILSTLFFSEINSNYQNTGCVTADLSDIMFPNKACSLIDMHTNKESIDKCTGRVLIEKKTIYNLYLYIEPMEVHVTDVMQLCKPMLICGE